MMAQILVMLILVIAWARKQCLVLVVPKTYITHKGPCDWQRKGVNVFDMSAATWGSVYSTKTSAYTVPSAVVSKIGGTGMGGAKAFQPVGGFEQKGLADLFNVQSGGSTSDENGTTSPSSSSSSESNSSRTRRLGAILGSILGGSTLTALAMFILLRNRQRLENLHTEVAISCEEMDGGTSAQKRAEMMARDLCWEMPIRDEKPLEMLCPEQDVEKAELQGWRNSPVELKAEDLDKDCREHEGGACPKELAEKTDRESGQPVGEQQERKRFSLMQGQRQAWI